MSAVSVRAYDWVSGLTLYTIDDKEYVGPALESFEFGSLHLRLVTKDHERTNVCDSCGRSDWRQVVYYSYEEMIEKRYIIPREEWERMTRTERRHVSG